VGAGILKGCDGPDRAGPGQEGGSGRVGWVTRRGGWGRPWGGGGRDGAGQGRGAGGRGSGETVLSGMFSLSRSGKPDNSSSFSYPSAMNPKRCCFISTEFHIIMHVTSSW
jgi:hypothetical protein